MKTIGFVISKKENERRRALIPPDLHFIKNTHCLYFERGYGKVLGYSDKDYHKMNCNVVDSEDVFEQDIICSVKTPELRERKFYRKHQILFGWIHAVQGRDITDFLVERKMTAIAWEEMFEDGKTIFWRNNEIAGEAGVLHAFLSYGKAPYECSAAVIGRGNTARGAIRVLEKLGTNVTVYDRKTISFLRKELERYDFIINCVLWDVFRKDRLIHHEDLKRMKKGAMIVDISCDPNLEIETSRATTINDPVFETDGIVHYCVDHTATLFWKTASASISKQVRRFVDDLVEERENKILTNATIIINGKILDEKIIKSQNRI